MNKPLSKTQLQLIIQEHVVGGLEKRSRTELLDAARQLRDIAMKCEALAAVKAEIDLLK